MTTSPQSLEIAEPADLARQTTAGPLEDSRVGTYEVPGRDYWITIYSNVVLAGAAYPTILGIGTLVVWLLIAIASFSLSWPNIEMIFAMSFSVPLFVIYTALVGGLWAGIVAAFTAPVVHVFISSLKLRIPLPILGAGFGGLVAFLSVLPFMLSLPYDFQSSQIYAVFVALIAGPGVAVPIGQLGGAIGGRRAESAIQLRRRQQRKLLKKEGWLSPIHSEVSEEVVLEEVPAQAFQFRIYHMLWIGVWLSLLLTAIRLAGIPYQLILPLLILVAVYQVLTFYAGRWLAGWAIPRWNRWRQTRST